MTTIGELARSGALTFGDGYRTRRDQHDDSGFRILRAGDVRDGQVFADGSDFVSRDFAPAIGGKAARAGDVVLTTKGTVGRTAVVRMLAGDVVYSPQVCYFRVLDPTRLVGDFLCYWLRSPAFVDQAGYLKNSTDMAPYISLSDLATTSIELPPLPTQRAVAEVLGALDDKIAENARLAVITADLLVGVGALLANGNDTVPLRVLAVSRKTQVSPTGLGEVSHFSLPAFDAGAGPLAEDGDSILSAKLKIERPSVLISRLNPRIPRIWEVPEVPERPALTSTEFLVLEPVGVSTAALWAVLAQPSVSSRLQELARGTSGSHQRVHPDEVLAVGVADARQFSDDQAELVVSLSRRRQAAQAESRLLAEFRDTLLPPLMSGRLTVREAEQRVGELL